MTSVMPRVAIRMRNPRMKSCSLRLAYSLPHTVAKGFTGIDSINKLGGHSEVVKDEICAWEEDADSEQTIYLRAAICRVFNVDMSRDYKRHGWKPVKEIEIIRRIPSALAIVAMSQAHHKPVTTLYRGVVGYQADDIFKQLRNKRNKTINFKVDCLSSFSEDPHTAGNFGDVVLKLRVPRSKIAVSHASHILNTGEDEVIVVSPENLVVPRSALIYEDEDEDEDEDEQEVANW